MILGPSCTRVVIAIDQLKTIEVDLVLLNGCLLRLSYIDDARAGLMLDLAEFSCRLPVALFGPHHQAWSEVVLRDLGLHLHHIWLFLPTLWQVLNLSFRIRCRNNLMRLYFNLGPLFH